MVLMSVIPTAYAMSQCKIFGSVSEEINGKPLSYVIVSLLRPDSSFVRSTATDSLGVYQLEGVDCGDYVLSFVLLGYQPKAMPLAVGGDVNVGVVALEVDEAVLDEIVVAGRGFIRQKDKLIIIPDKASLKHSTTSYDMLANLMIPGVDVDRRNGRVTRFGTEVSLYIDGRRAERGEVQNLRPRDVEKVEYIDVPHGKYVQDAAAINYITKQSETGGYLSADAMQAMGYLGGDYNLSGKLSRGNTSFAIFGGYARKRADNHSRRHDCILFPDVTMLRDYDTYRGRTDDGQQYVQLNLENRTERRNVVVKGSFVRKASPGNYSKSSLVYNGANDNAVHSSESISKEALRPALTFYGDFRFKNNHTLEMTAIANYSNTKYSRSYLEDGAFATHASLSNREDRYTSYFTAYYGLPLNDKDALSLMAANFNVFSTVNYEGSGSEVQRMRTCESLLFVQYGHEFNAKLSLNILSGLSLLNYAVKGSDPFISPYLRWNSWLNYSIGKTQMLAWSVNISNTHPMVGYMNDMEQEVNLLQVSRGNPNLESTKSYITSLNYNAQCKTMDWSAMVSYQYYDDNTFRDYYIDVERGKLVGTYSTDGHLHQLSFNTSVAWRPTEHFRLKLDGWYSYNRAKGKQRVKQHCLNGTAAAFVSWKDWSVNISVRSRQKVFSQVLSWQEYPFRYNLSLAWHRAGWSIEAGADNLFMKDVKVSNVTDAGVYGSCKDIYDELNGQSGYVKVACTLDFGRKTSRSANDVSKTIGTSMMMVE